MFASLDLPFLPSIFLVYFALLLSGFVDVYLALMIITNSKLVLLSKSFGLTKWTLAHREDRLALISQIFTLEQLKIKVKFNCIGVCRSGIVRSKTFDGRGLRVSFTLRCHGLVRSKPKTTLSTSNLPIDSLELGFLNCKYSRSFN